jgi:hypothetical protein
MTPLILATIALGAAVKTWAGLLDDPGDIDPRAVTLSGIVLSAAIWAAVVYIAFVFAG